MRFAPRFPTEGRNTKVVLVLRILYNGKLFMTYFIRFLRFIRVPFVPLGIAEKEETLATTLRIYFVSCNRKLFMTYVIRFLQVFFVRDKLDWLIYRFASFRWFRREWIWSWVLIQKSKVQAWPFWLAAWNIWLLYVSWSSFCFEWSEAVFSDLS